MKHVIYGSRYIDELRDIVADELESRIIVQVGQIIGRSRKEVVYTYNRMSIGEKPVTEV